MNDLPIEILFRSNFLTLLYGMCFIVKTKEDIYELYYPNYETGELVKDVQ